MKKTLMVAILIVAAILVGRKIQSAPLQSAAAPSGGLASFRIVFGEKQERSLDYSGSIVLTAGKIVKLTPWRFFGGDAVQGDNRWKLTTKRTQFESQPDDPPPPASPGEVPTTRSASQFRTSAG